MKSKVTSYYLDAADICQCDRPILQPQEIRKGAPGQIGWDTYDRWFVPFCFFCQKARTANPIKQLERCQKYCDEANNNPDEFIAPIQKYEFPHVRTQKIRLDAPKQQNLEEYFNGCHVPICHICRRAHKADSKPSREKCQKHFDSIKNLSIIAETIAPNVFLSWDSKDKSKASDLKRELNDIGINVNFVSAERELGQNLPDLIDKNLKESQIAIIFCSREYLENDSWAKMERCAIMNLKSKGKIEVIPILYEMTAEELTSESPLLAPIIFIECPTGTFDAKFTAEKIKEYLNSNFHN